ncbi:MAG: helix-turn-helix domain-containing protein [Solirubrobacterales bacterium]|nr:helix-turn-helix domain-containing protein [Solirubrobacterales bacterium]
MSADGLTAAQLLDLLGSDVEALRELRRLLGAQTAPAYTVSTLAAALAVSQRVVRNAIARGELCAVKRGARWYIAADAVEAWTHGEHHSRVAPQVRQVRHPLASAFERVDERATGAA